MNQLDFAGRTAIVTGGAAGIGLAIAQRLAASGARLSLWDRDSSALHSARENLRVSCDVQQVDITDADAVAAAARRSADALGQVDVLVCSAGITGASISTSFAKVKC